MFSQEINKDTLMITITILGEVRFLIRFLHIFHHKFDNTTRDLLCKSNR